MELAASLKLLYSLLPYFYPMEELKLETCLYVYICVCVCVCLYHLHSWCSGLTESNEHLLEVFKKGLGSVRREIERQLCHSYPSSLFFPYLPLCPLSKTMMPCLEDTDVTGRVKK